MAGKATGKIDGLLRQAQWDEARSLLERELRADPNNHWLLTQQGVTFYEQRQYQEAIKLFLASQKIMPHCPLTLWNLAGALDATGKHAGAMGIFTWLLQNKESPRSDPCWESKQWADALKADCVYRVGLCFQHLGKKSKAESCYRQYLNLLSIGIEGLYSIDDVKRQMREVQGTGRVGTEAVESRVRAAVKATLAASGVTRQKGRRGAAAILDVPSLVRGRRVASKS